MVTVRWDGGAAFEAEVPSGVPLVLDSHPDFGGKGRGPTPVETLLASVAACSAMDVVSILEKMRQKVTAYRVEVDGDRPPPGDYPRAFSEIRIRHVVTGENIDPQAVAKAVALSDEKYCTVITTLRASPKVRSEFVIESP